MADDDLKLGPTNVEYQKLKIFMNDSLVIHYSGKSFENICSFTASKKLLRFVLLFFSLSMYRPILKKFSFPSQFTEKWIHLSFPRTVSLFFVFIAPSFQKFFCQCFVSAQFFANVTSLKLFTIIGGLPKLLDHHPIAPGPDVINKFQHSLV